MAFACLLAALAFAVPPAAGGKGKSAGGGGKAGHSSKKDDSGRSSGQESSKGKGSKGAGSAKTRGGGAGAGGSGHVNRPRARASATSKGSKAGGGASKSGSTGSSGKGTRAGRSPTSSSGGAATGRGGATGGGATGGGSNNRGGANSRRGNGGGGKGSATEQSTGTATGRALAPSTPSFGASPLVAGSGPPSAGAFAGAAPVALAPDAAAGGSAPGFPGAAGEPLRVEPPSASPVVRTVRRVVEVVPPTIWLLIAILAAMTLFFGAGSWLLAYRGRRLERQREALLEDVGLLQRALLPPAPEQLAGVATSVAYLPAKGPDAGGVFYDVFALDHDRLGMLIGELSAGGRRALGLTALVRHTVRAYLEAGFQPRTALQLGARVLTHQLAGERASVTAATYDRAHGTLTYAASGHPPPVLLGTAAFEPITACASPPIGVQEPTGLRQTTVSLPPGSVVCFYTEGVVTAPVRTGPFGYRGLWLALGELGSNGDARTLLDRIADDADSPPGDMAACLLRVAHHVPASVSQGLVRRVEELELFRGDLETDRPAEFLAACGVPTDRIDTLVEEFRTTGARLGGAMLRVLVGPGLPRAELALNRVELMPAFTPAAARA